VGRRIDIEADDVAQFIDELRIVGELELAPAVGLQPVRLPDTTHRTRADAGRGRHHVGGPVRRLARRVLQRQRHHTLSHFRPERRNARGSRLVAQQSFEAFRCEALLPTPYAGLGFAGLPHDLDGAHTVAAQQNDLGAPNMLLRRIANPDQRAQALAINRRNGEDIPVRMRQTRMRTRERESQAGLLC
jgi:hypothetical protein